MHKVPTEFIPLRGPRGQVTSCKVTQKSCVDYLGHFRGIAVAVEAKNTQDARIDFSAVQEHQAEFLDDWMAADGNQLAFVAVSFGMNRFFTVPWPFWKAGRDAWEQHKRTKRKIKKIVQAYGWTWETPGTASVTADGLHPEWEISTGGIYGLPYLQIIDQIAGGNKNDEDRGPGC
jgi:recombination protein U